MKQRSYNSYDFTWAEVGQRVRDWRMAKGMSQEALASASNLSQPGLCRVETGETNPQLDTLSRLGKVLGRSVRELLCGSYLQFQKDRAFFIRADQVLSSGDQTAIDTLENGLKTAEAFLYRAGRDRLQRRVVAVDPSKIDVLFKGKPIVKRLDGKPIGGTYIPGLKGNARAEGKPHVRAAPSGGSNVSAPRRLLSRSGPEGAARGREHAIDKRFEFKFGVIRNGE